MNNLPLKITLGSFQIFEISWRYLQAKATGNNDTGGNFSPVTTTPVANLSPVSMTLTENFPPVPMVSIIQVSTPRWQIMGTISYYLHIKVYFKEKNLSMLILLSKGAKTK